MQLLDRPLEVGDLELRPLLVEAQDLAHGVDLVFAFQSNSSIASITGSTGAVWKPSAASRSTSVDCVRTWTSCPRRRSSSSIPTGGKTCPGVGDMYTRSRAITAPLSMR